MNVLSSPTSIKSYNATKTPWILVWEWYLCLNWRDVFLCPEVNAGEREAQCAGRLLAATSSYIQWKAYKELFLLYITTLSSSDVSRKGLQLLSGISLNCRINEVGRDLWKSLIQCPAYGKGRCSRLCAVEVWLCWAGGSISSPGSCSSHLLSYWISTQKLCCCQGNEHLPRRSLGFRRQINVVQFAHSTSSYPSWPWEWILGGFAPSIPAHSFSWQQGVAVLYSRYRHCRVSLLSKLIPGRWVQITLASSWLGCSQAFSVFSNKAFTTA